VGISEKKFYIAKITRRAKRAKGEATLTLSFSYPKDFLDSERLPLGAAEFAFAASLSVAADGSTVTAAAEAADAGAAENSSYSLRAKPDCPHNDSASQCHLENG
jgi:hypothetical protein